MTHQEQIKIDNFKAHYNSILHNISDANKRLEYELSTANEVREEYRSVSEKLSKKKKELEELSQLEIEVSKKINNERIILDKREQELDTKSLEINKAVDVKLGIMEQKKSVLSDEIRVKNKELSMLRKTIKDSVSEINKLNTRTEDLRREVTNQAVHLNNLKEDVVTLSNKKQDLILEYNKEYNTQTYKLKQAQEETKKEIDRTSEPYKNLIKREEKLAGREKDFEILVVRLRKLYQEIKPGISLKI